MIVYINNEAVMQKRYEEIIFYMRKNNGFIRTNEVLKKKINNKYLSELLAQNVITRPKRGLYMLKKYNFSSSLVEVSKIVPNGIICLQSALSYYNISTVEPNSYILAVRQGVKIKLPEYPPIELHYYSKVQFETGVKDIVIDGHKVKIYDMEKTICDVVRYRNKIGIDVMRQALNEYLARKDKKISVLYSYAELLRVKNVLKKYMEVLV
jgi:predicted transcriptional regulator of viral defense system